MPNETIKTVALEALEWFENAKRVPSGERYMRTKEGTPQWVRQLVQDAHGDMLPDDWRYRAIRGALASIAEDGEDAEVEPDVYTNQLTQWLASHVSRLGHCDTYIRDVNSWAPLPTMFTILQGGQKVELDEIMASVLSSLIEQLNKPEWEEVEE